MIDNSKLFTIIIEAGIIIGGAILFIHGIKLFIRGRKLNGLGILLLAISILACSFTTYGQLSGLNHFLPDLANQVILLLESICFAAGSVLLSI